MENLARKFVIPQQGSIQKRVHCRYAHQGNLGVSTGLQFHPLDDDSVCKTGGY